MEAVNACLATCGRPLEFQQKYALASYTQYQRHLQQQLQECKGKQECIEKVKQDFMSTKANQFKSDYVTYLEELVARNSVKA